MTDTDRMVDWLRDAMDSAERIAHAACWDDQSDVWTARPPQASYERYTVVDYLDDGVVVVTPENADADGVGQHVALNDPAAVLRRIAADRQVLDLHAPVTVEYEDDSPSTLACRTCGSHFEYPKRWPCTTLRLLAEGYGWTHEGEK